MKNLTKTKFFANFINLSSIQVSNTLLMILMIPVMTRAVGIEMFGQVMVVNAFGGLMGILVNYATIQTSIKDIATQTKNTIALSKIFTETLLIRLILFLPVTVFLIFSSPIFKDNYWLYLSALLLIFAEVINPLFFYLGQEDLKLFNIANLIAKVITILSILLFIHDKRDGIWINVIMGGVNVISYLVLLIIIIKKFSLKFIRPSNQHLISVFKQNFYLVVNNFSVHLQQSLMLFVLQKWGTEAWLGAYSLCDKIVWSSRLLIVAITNSVYPKSAKVFKEGINQWNKFKREIKIYSGGVFFLFSMVLFIFPKLIIFILLGHNNETAVFFLRVMAFVPTMAALNYINVLDRLLSNDTKSIFQIAFVLLLLSLILSYSLVKSQSYFLFGVYTLIIDSAAFVLYEIQIRRKNRNWL